MCSFAMFKSAIGLTATVRSLLIKRDAVFAPARLIKKAFYHLGLFLRR